MKMHARKPFLAALAAVVALAAGDAVAGKSDRYGRQLVTYEEAVDDGGTWTRAAPLPTQEKGGYTKTAGCVEVACATTGDGGILSLTVETDYRMKVTTNSPVRVSNGASCVGFNGGVGAILNEGEHTYWKAPAGVGPDGGVAKYECCALAAHSAAAPVIVQACPR